MISVQERSWTEQDGWSEPAGTTAGAPQLVFVFGDRALIERPELYQQIKQFYPSAHILMGSTAGNILGDEVTGDSVTVSALHFEKTKISFAETIIEDTLDSDNIGKKLAEFLPTEGLIHSFVLSDGLSVNGSALVRGINEHLPGSVTVTGGLSGDGESFKKTVVGVNAVPASNRVALIGFYGSSLKVGHAAKGGWKATSEAFTVTKSDGSVLYTLNDEPVLDVYKRLLGSEADKLPGSGLLFPLQLQLPDEGLVVRTILGIDESAGSMTFAGDMPEGSVAHLMHASDDELIESAKEAAAEAAAALSPAKTQFALLVSCVGRRLVLKEKTAKEVAAVHGAVGSRAAIHGFYSYGELCPARTAGTHCLMHNQTMTVTTFAEV